MIPVLDLHVTTLPTLSAISNIYMGSGKFINWQAEERIELCLPPPMTNESQSNISHTPVSYPNIFFLLRLSSLTLTSACALTEQFSLNN